jgi:hypothetical protein
MLTRLEGAPLCVLAALLVGALHLVPLPKVAPRERPNGAAEPTHAPRAALETAHAERRVGALGAAEVRYADVALDPRAPALLREEATYWSLQVRLAAGDPLAREALAGFVQRARSPDLVLRAAGLACTYARDSDERRRASALAHAALLARAEVATDDGLRWRAALARLAERAESSADFFREKSEKALHSALDCP